MSDQGIDTLLGEINNREIEVKVEFVFGIRKDIFPNIFVLDADFIIYPAANFIVIYNNTLKFNKKPQQLISGTCHSNGNNKSLTSN